MANIAKTLNMEEKPFRVLTLDGGGMRGLYTATLLKILSKRFDPRFHNKEPDIGKAFDLICGTSTGAILACALAAGIPLSRVKNLYIEKGAKIFKQPLPKGKTSALGWWAWKHRNKPAADSNVLLNALTECFGDLTLRKVFEIRHIALCIPTITATNHRARVLKTPHNRGKHRDGAYSLTEICMASAAAPIFFPIATRKKLNDDYTIHHFVDGGLWANNPVLIGLTEALGMATESQTIEVVSVGTCDQPSGDPHGLENRHWGLKDWRAGVRIVEMSLAAQSYGISATARFLANHLSRCGRSVRVARLEETNKSPEQYSAIGLDRADPIAIKTLLSLAEADADHNHSKAMSDSSTGLDLVKDIFSKLPKNQNSV
jgi:predicted acylesterase/phospholipase RssA